MGYRNVAECFGESSCGRLGVETLDAAYMHVGCHMEEVDGGGFNEPGSGIKLILSLIAIARTKVRLSHNLV